MTKTIDLLHGKIMRSLCILAVPIVMTYFIQMAYNFIDMIWIGRLGSGAVAGVGVAGMFTWFFQWTGHDGQDGRSGEDWSLPRRR